MPESVGGRAEAGYRIFNAVAAVTPYAAVQAQAHRHRQGPA
jgi:hypothetical protein